MDQNFKQRLVGVIVITALAAIFIPMMFDDPVDKSGRMVSQLKIPEFPDKEFSPRGQKAPETIEEVVRAGNAPPEEYGQQQAPPAPASAERVISPVTDKNTETSSQLVRWVIQAGSFGEEKNAEKLRDTLRKQGFPAFVEPFGSMFRVRVGPELDKSRAEQMKQKLEKENNIKSILVSE